MNLLGTLFRFGKNGKDCEKHHDKLVRKDDCHSAQDAIKETVKTESRLLKIEIKAYVGEQIKSLQSEIKADILLVLANISRKE